MLNNVSLSFLQLRSHLKIRYEWISNDFMVNKNESQNSYSYSKIKHKLLNCCHYFISQNTHISQITIHSKINTIINCTLIYNYKIYSMAHPLSSTQADGVSIWGALQWPKGAGPCISGGGGGCGGGQPVHQEPSISLGISWIFCSWVKIRKKLSLVLKRARIKN